MQKDWHATLGGVIALVILIGLGMLCAPPAKGQLPISLSVQAGRADSGNTTEAIYYLRAKAGAEQAAFGFNYQLPTWPSPVALSGSPIAITAVNLNGSGGIRPAASPPLPKPRLKRGEACRREGPSSFATSYWVELPAYGTTEIELRGRASYPSWPATQYDLAFSTFEVDEPTAARSPLQTVSTARLGSMGTRISMDSLKGKGSSKGPRMTPKIVGRTDPILAFTPISFRAVRPSPGGYLSLSQWGKPSPMSVALGHVYTDKQGRFTLDPQKFPFAGRYGLLARSAAKGRIVADWNCGPRF